MVLVDCQPVRPADTAVQHGGPQQSRHRRRLATYNRDDYDSGVDAGWLLGVATAAAAAASITSLIALCTCCPPLRNHRYVVCVWVSFERACIQGGPEHLFKLSTGILVNVENFAV